MKNLTHEALAILASHPYALATLGFVGMLSIGLCKLTAMLNTIS